jgi:hypothetical protein
MPVRVTVTYWNEARIRFDVIDQKGKQHLAVHRPVFIQFNSIDLPPRRNHSSPPDPQKPTPLLVCKTDFATQRQQQCPSK